MIPAAPKGANQNNNNGFFITQKGEKMSDFILFSSFLFLLFLIASPSLGGRSKEKLLNLKHY
jgi:hypothetical protein